MPSNWQTRPMSAGERRLWRKLKTQAAQFSPAMQRAIERSFDAVRLSLSVSEMTALLETTRSDAFVTALLGDAELNKSFNPARARLIATTEAATNGFIRDLPGGFAATSGFNVLDPRVLEAIDKLDTRVMKFLRGDIRETARAVYRAGIEKGLGAETIARQVRSTIGLAPNQFQQIANFREALEAGDIKKAFRYTLRDKRFDRTLAKLAQGTPPTPAQIDKMTAAYQRARMVSNAKIHARTAVNDSQRLGKHLATQAGIDSGALPPADQMRSRWSASGDDRVRPTHVAAHGEVVRFGEPFSTGDVIPGASEWQCRCIKIDFVARPKSGLTKPEKAKVPKPPKPPKPKVTPTPTPSSVLSLPIPSPDDLVPRIRGTKPDYSFAKEVFDNLKTKAAFAQQQISDGTNSVFNALGGRLDKIGVAGKRLTSIGGRMPRRAEAAYWPKRDWIMFSGRAVTGTRKRALNFKRQQTANRERWVEARRIAQEELDRTHPAAGLQGKRDRLQGVIKSFDERLATLEAGANNKWVVSEFDIAEELFSTAAHEAAHASYYQGGMHTPWTKFYRELDAKPWGRNTMFRVSEYAATNPQELFAETTALIAMGRQTDVPEVILKAWLRITADARAAATSLRAALAR